jgi:hypothetical protein
VVIVRSVTGGLEVRRFPSIADSASRRINLRDCLKIAHSVD